MKHFRLYSFLSLVAVLSLALVSACTTPVSPTGQPATAETPAASGPPSSPATPRVSGAPDLVISKVWL